MTVLQDISLEAQIRALKAENEALKRKAQDKGSAIKVSAKGAVSVYGMGRFPVTLYQGQWEKLFAMQDDIKAFIAANASRLSSKPAKDEDED